MIGSCVLPEEDVEVSFFTPSSCPLVLGVVSKGLFVLIDATVLETFRSDGSTVELSGFEEAGCFAVETRADVTVEVDSLPCVEILVAGLWLVECPAPVSREALLIAGDVAMPFVGAVPSTPVTEL